MPKFYYRWFSILLTGASLAVFPVLPPAGAQAVPESAWFKTESPVFKELEGNVPAALMPAYGNKDCTRNTKFITMPRNLSGAQAEASRQVCAVQTAFGHQAAGDNLIRLNDHSVAGPLKSSNGGSLTLQPVRNSRNAMYLSGGLYGAYHYLVKDVADNIITSVQPDGSVVHRLKPGITGTGLADPAGNLADLTEVYFSDNAKWLVGDVHLQGMRRINLETGESLIFQAGYNHAVGTRPHFVSAISGDGRFVFTSDLSYGVLRLYDLSACTPGNSPLLPANCRFRNILPLAQSQIVNFNGIRHARFSTNHTLRLYAGKTTGQYGYYTLTAAGEKESLLDYLALGDSFASGEGAFSYKPGTDVRQPVNGCHLSTLSYPYLLGARTSLNSIQSVACSGARLRDVVSYNYTESAAQSKGRNSPANDADILANFLPGYRPQVNFIDRTKPAHVTLSISGNDIGFSRIILSCLAPGTCYTGQQERINLVHTINSRFSQLVSTIESVKYGAGSGARIYVIGYPSLAAEGGNCAVNVRLDQAEIRFSNELLAYLNSVIKSAAAKAGAIYVDVEQAFAGHRLCETESNNAAVHGATAGDDKTFSLPVGSNYTVDGYFTGRESYHPNQLGHRLLSDAIAGATKNFQSSMPAANPSVAEPSAGADAPALTGPGAHLLAPRKIQFEEDLAPSVIVRGQNTALAAKNLLPAAASALRIDSQPAALAGGAANSNGLLKSTFMVPDNLAPGLYTLRLGTKNAAGEAIDIQKVVYVAAAAADFDGDSISNDEEACLFIDPARQDKDQDGTDDACDGFIDGPPVAGPQHEPATDPKSSPGPGSASLAPASAPENSAGSSQAAAKITPAVNPPVPVPSGAAVFGAAVSGQQPPLHTAERQKPRQADSGTIKTVLSMAILIVITLIAGYLLLRKWRRRT